MSVTLRCNNWEIEPVRSQPKSSFVNSRLTRWAGLKACFLGPLASSRLRRKCRLEASGPRAVAFFRGLYADLSLSVCIRQLDEEPLPKDDAWHRPYPCDRFSRADVNGIGLEVSGPRAVAFFWGLYAHFPVARIIRQLCFALTVCLLIGSPLPAAAQFVPSAPDWPSADSAAKKLQRSKFPRPRRDAQNTPDGDGKDSSAEHLRVPLALPRLTAKAKILFDGDAAVAEKEYERALQLYRYGQRGNPYDGELVVREAEVLFRQGKNAQCEDRAQQACRLNLSDTRALLILAEALLAQGSEAKALNALEQAEALNAPEKRVHRLLAQLYAASGSTEKSDREFAHVLQLDSSDSYATINLAAHLSAQGRLEEAIKLARSAAPEVDSAQLHIQHGLLLMQAHRYAEAAEQFKQARDIDPHDPLSFEMLSVVAGARQDWLGAQDYGQSFSDVDYGNVNALALAAWSTYFAGDLQEARLAYQKALAVMPGSPMLHELYGLVLTDSRRYADAAKELQEAARLRKASPVAVSGAHPPDPSSNASGSSSRGSDAASNASGSSSRGSDAASNASDETLVGKLNEIALLNCQGKYIESVAKADEFGLSESIVPSAVSLAAYSHWNKGDISTARTLAEKSINTDSGDCLARLTLSNILKSEGKYNDALSQLDALGASWRGTALVLTARARILLDRGSYRDAEETAQLALQIAPSSQPAKQVFAYALAKQKNWEGAILFLKELVARTPSDMEMRMVLADALEHRGDLDSAQTAYEKACKMDSKSPWPLLGLAHLALLQKNKRLARQYAQQAFDLDSGSLRNNDELNGLVRRSQPAIQRKTARKP